MKIFNSKIIRIAGALTLLSALVLVIYIFAQPKPQTKRIFLEKEYTYKQAHIECAQRESSLPRLGLLIQLARFDLLPHPKTDYWSSLSISRFAFGWSTRKMMLSFDPHDDTDHVVCVQEK